VALTCADAGVIPTVVMSTASAPALIMVHLDECPAVDS
jgi:hypothetical protein